MIFGLQFDTSIHQICRWVKPRKFVFRDHHIRSYCNGAEEALAPEDRIETLRINAMSGIKKKGPAHKAPKKATAPTKADDRKVIGRKNRRTDRARQDDGYENFD